MSGQYTNRDRGALFKNQKKGSDKHPDYNGSINVNGIDYWLSAWLKDSKAGMKYMSLSIKPKLESDRASVPTGGRNDPRTTTEKEFDDELPF